MQTRAELKTQIKQLFKGRWRSAIGLCIVVSLLSIFQILADYSEQRSSGTDLSATPDVTGNVTQALSHVSIADLTLAGGVLSGILLVQLVIGLVIALFKIGTSYSMLDWVRNPQRAIHPVSDATVAFTRQYGWSVIGLIIYRTVLIILWGCLLIVPGIIKAYAYSQAYYVYKDMVAATPQGGPKPRFRDAITRSRQLMRGHKWQLFVLQLSFIGWALLSILTAGIGQLWLVPYTYGTYAAYYDELTRVTPATV